MGKLLTAATALALLTGAAASAEVWRVEMVDQSGPGRFSTLRVDPSGNAHLSYIVQDENHFPLKYGFWDHALKRWFLMTVAEGASFSSMAIDSKERAHIAWADYGSGSGTKLRYAHWTGKEWLKQDIPLTSDVIAYYTSIVLDSQDRPTISFYEYRGPKDSDIHIRLRTVMWDGRQWQVRTVDGQEGSGKFNSMAVDSKNGIHLGYANVSAGTSGMRYAYWNGTSWMAEIVDAATQDTGGSLGYSNSIAVDKDGDPHMIYVNQSKAIVKYAFRKGGKWQVQSIDQLSGVGYPDRSSIALDEDGQPYLSYYDAGKGALKLAYRLGKQWMVQIVDRNAVGFTSSLQIDHGTVWIAYEDEGNSGIKVARMEPEAHDLSVEGSDTRRKPR